MPLRTKCTHQITGFIRACRLYDVDDALALLNAALELTPQAKIEGLSIVGGSRGAGVALLAGIRDERIENIVALFGPFGDRLEHAGDVSGLFK